MSSVPLLINWMHYCWIECVPVWLSGRACVSSANGCGFDSQGTHILMKMFNLNANCKSLWIKASAKCINVNKCRSISFLKNKNKCFRTVLYNYILQLHKHFSLKYTVQIFTSFLWDILKLVWVNKSQNYHGKSGNIRKCSICNSQAWKSHEKMK